MIFAQSTRSASSARPASSGSPACEAAVAWVLIALAKRAAAWARDVDAELARCYRAATLAFDAHRERGPQGGNTAAYARKRDALEDAVSAADVALLRGYP